jgi:hypothetical protein
VSTVNVLALLHEHLVGVWRFPCLVYFLLDGLLSIFNSQSIKVCKNQTLKISLCILASMDCPQPIHGYIHVKEDAWHHLLREVPTSFCARRPEQQSQRCTVWIQSTAPSVLLLARITFVKTPNHKEGLKLNCWNVFVVAGLELKSVVSGRCAAAGWACNVEEIHLKGGSDHFIRQFCGKCPLGMDIAQLCREALLLLTSSSTPQSLSLPSQLQLLIKLVETIHRFWHIIVKVWWSLRIFREKGFDMRSVTATRRTAICKMVFTKCTEPQRVLLWGLFGNPL